MFDKRKWQKAQQTHAEKETTTITTANRPIKSAEREREGEQQTHPKRTGSICVPVCPAFQEPSRGNSLHKSTCH